jgi:hypothetical protein
VVAAVVGAVLLTGCSGGGAPDEGTGQTTSGEGSSAAPAEEPAAAGGSATAHPSDIEGALATVSTTALDPKGEPMDLALLEATVTGDLLRVRIAYVPKFDVEDTNVYTLAGDHDPAPYLVDPVNLKRYGVVRAKGSGELASDVVFTDGNDEQPPVLTYYFAAPPDDVDELSLSFGGAPWPGFDVTVAR